MKQYRLTVASPDGNLFSGEAVFLSVRGTEGELAVLADHIPLITSLVPCEVRVELPDGSLRIGRAEGGLLTVAPEGVTLLSGSFAWTE